MKLWTKTLVLGVAGAGVLASAAAFAMSKPLLVIRFNQRKVYFEQPLYSAASRAMDRKADVQFNIVSYVPIAGNPEQDNALAQRAAENVRDVTSALMKIGVPPQQVRTSSQAGNGLNFDEIHIYVQ